MARDKVSAPLGASLVVLSSFFYATYGIWTKLMGDFFDGYTATALRGGIIVMILLFIAFCIRRLEPLRVKDNWPYIAGMVGGSLFSWGPYYYAVLHAGIGISLAVEYASIVIAMFFFGRLLAQERFSKSKAFSAALGIAGLVLIFTPSVHGIGWLALFGAVIGGISSAFNIVLVKRVHYKALQATIVLWTCSVIANVLMAFLLHKSYPAFHGQVEWLYLFIFAVASVIASWSLTRGVKLIDAGAAGILGLLEIVFGVLFGLMFFHEKLGLLVILGVILILAAAAIPYIKDYNAQRGTLNA